jgi:ABC-type polysaccharide/polyol phosphate transport system ATPase subunit
MIAVELKDVWKKYRRHTERPLTTTLKSYLLHDFWRRGNGSRGSIAAIQNVSLRIEKGTTLGIIGRNGSGKSTLLKLIARIIKPDSGTIHVNGKVSALLELGAGFHPDLTGRENVIINGIILGLTHNEIRLRMDEIVDFAELRDYIDEPVRTYSSGMYMRLAFSTAVHVEPEVLIVDEVLAVGDGAFVEKCMDRMNRFKKLGKTIILVTHNLPMVSHWCHEAVWLDGGCLKMKGGPAEVVQAYRSLLLGQQQQGRAQLSESPIVCNGEVPLLRYGDGSCRILDFGILDSYGQKITEIQSGQSCTMFMRVQFNEIVSDMSCGFAIKDRMSAVLYGVTNISQNMPPIRVQAGEVMTISANIRMWLAEGDYFVSLGVARWGSEQKCDFIEDGIQFKVFGPGGIFTTSVVNLETRFAMTSEPRVARNPGQGAEVLS